ncbi:MAG: 50S ribosomal protein L35 [Phycisphaerae bacterium]|nr:50S ribosomal protein L35 [Phycisphaerae bacterium]
MPKVKTRKSVAKRVKVTARGKVLHRVPGSGHLKSRKPPSRIRHFRKERPLPPAFAKQAKRLLGM